MSSLHAAPLRVHSNPPALRIAVIEDVEPFMSPEDTFEPTPTQQAYWTAFCLALEGNPGWADRFAGPAIGLAWSRGTLDGTKEFNRLKAEEDAQMEAWVAIEERERFEEILAPENELRDSDVWPAGCLS